MTDDAATFRRVPEELVNERKLHLIEELFAEDYVEHAFEDGPGFPPNRQGIRMFFEQLLSAFPDFRFEVVRQHQDGDMHIEWLRGTGTMKGDFMGMPASGQTATWDEVHFGRVVNGKIQEHWVVIDQVSMLRQLGFVPEPGGG